MVRIDRVVTRGGDNGATSLGDCSPVPKAFFVLAHVHNENAALGAGCEPTLMALPLTAA